MLSQLENALSISVEDDRKVFILILLLALPFMLTL